MGYRKLMLDSYIDVKSVISCFREEHDKDFVFSGEMHDFWELVFVGKGKIGITADERVFILEKNHIVFHKPMEFHRLWGCDGSDSEITVMAFEANGIGMKFFENSVFEVPEKQLEIIDTIVNTAQSKGNIINENLSPYAKQKIKINTELFLFNFVDSKNMVLSENSITYSNYNLIINILKNNVDKRLTVSRIASLCKMGESNLKKVFKMYSGEGVMTYFNRLKILEAKKMLNENISVNEVSLKLSFSSQNYFTVFFKRETGILPTSYRQQKLIE